MDKNEGWTRCEAIKQKQETRDRRDVYKRKRRKNPEKENKNDGTSQGKKEHTSR